ncbi:hypothetical protein Q9L58_010529 [Maublancomyces gigas]|uniref:Uncharacterized protein n=1 Tax=Discina gigas TaxID=1032678 RepID=A0ABR3G3U8_9PEZI
MQWENARRSQPALIDLMRFRKSGAIGEIVICASLPTAPEPTAETTTLESTAPGGTGEPTPLPTPKKPEEWLISSYLHTGNLATNKEMEDSAEDAEEEEETFTPTAAWTLTLSQTTPIEQNARHTT